MKELQAIVAALEAAPAAETVLATLVTVEGSSYRRPGARLLITADGRRIGSISGGCLEEDVVARAQQVRKTGHADTVVYDTTTENDLMWGVGLGCHGVVRVLIEKLPARPAWAATLADNFAARCDTVLAVAHRGSADAPLGTRLANPDELAGNENLFVNIIRSPTALFVFGAGDDAQPITRFAHELGWHVTVADPRSAFATAERFPKARVLVVESAESLVGTAAPGPDALAVVMTHHYVHDVPLLRSLLGRPLAYLGLLGPKKRAARILEDLERESPGIAADALHQLHAPVGLDLGADSPEQVALSIIAEMQAVLSQRSARPLRERTRPIHDVEVFAPEVFAPQKP
ncbi:MAG: XdhC family protein [Opitutus sp.]